MAKAKPSGKTIKVTQIKSVIGTMQSHRATIRGLGLCQRGAIPMG